MSDLQEIFERASCLVERWGNASLPSGQTVEDCLTLEGISFWSVVAPVLAQGQVANAVTQNGSSGLKRTCLNLARKIKGTILDRKVLSATNQVACSEWPTGSTALVLGFSSYIYRETLHPLVQKLSARDDCAVRVLVDRSPEKEKQLDDSGQVFQTQWEHWGRESADHLKRLRAGLSLAKNELMAADGLQEIVEASGVSWKKVSSVFYWLVEICLPPLLLTAASALHIVIDHSPQIIISPDVNDPRTRIFCLAGRLAGIKTLELQFGFYGPNNVEWRFFIADHLAVTGAANFGVMLNHGISRDKMTITGSPRHDGSISWPSSLVSRIRAELGVPERKRMLLFASQPYYYGAFGSAEVRLDMMKALFEFSAQFRDFVLVVKPHPLERLKDLKSFAKLNSTTIFADKKMDIRDLIKSADAFVTFFSATTFDALVMNKPCLSLSFPGGCANSLFEQSGATLVARNSEEVVAALQDLDKDSGKVLKNLSFGRENFLTNWFYRLDGRSTDRVEEIVVDMMFSGEAGV